MDEDADEQLKSQAQGLQNLLQKYTPSQANELLFEILQTWRTDSAEQKTFVRRLAWGGFALVAIVIIGTGSLVYTGHLSGEMLSLLIGTLVGYVARLTSEKL